MSLNVEWQRSDYSRVPYWLYHDPDVYAREQELIFRGPTGSYLCLEAEMPEPGDFRTTWVGDTPVLVNRDRDGMARGTSTQWSTAVPTGAPPCVATRAAIPRCTPASITAGATI